VNTWTSAALGEEPSAHDSSSRAVGSHVRTSTFPTSPGLTVMAKRLRLMIPYPFRVGSTLRSLDASLSNPSDGRGCFHRGLSPLYHESVCPEGQLPAMDCNLLRPVANCLGHAEHKHAHTLLRWMGALSLRTIKAAVPPRSPFRFSMRREEGLHFDAHG
jgi:hypothetical protein